MRGDKEGVQNITPTNYVQRCVQRYDARSKERAKEWYENNQEYHKERMRQLRTQQKEERKEKQRTLMGEDARVPEIGLTSKQIRVLKVFYMNYEALTQSDVQGEIVGSGETLNEKTLVSAMKALRRHNLIKRFQITRPKGMMAHTPSDRRYKYYVITGKGEDEFEAHLNLQTAKSSLSSGQKII